MITLNELLNYPEEKIKSQLTVSHEHLLVLQFLDVKSEELLVSIVIEGWMINPMYNDMETKTLIDMLDSINLFDDTNEFNMRRLSQVIFALAITEDPHDYV